MATGALVKLNKKEIALSMITGIGETSELASVMGMALVGIIKEHKAGVAVMAKEAPAKAGDKAIVGDKSVIPDISVSDL